MIFVLALAFAAVGLSGLAVYQEARALHFATAKLPDRYDLLLGNSIDQTPSFRAQQYFLEGCFEATTSLYGRLKPPDQRRTIRQTCSQQIERILKDNPTNGLAWFAKALVGHLEGDTEALNEGLMTSRQVALHENWIAALRVNLSEDTRANLNTRNLERNEMDLLRLVQSWRGTQAIAVRFQENTLFRARVIKLVETLDDAAQARFVEALRASKVSAR